ncbi:MAG TPA: class IV adenylate cyclase [Patescibacteria group bacterium]|nr:class IV adenylate cyclase [Patescibacteria group bacterium]
MGKILNKEVEIKAKVTDFEVIKQKLRNLGCVFSEEIRQVDTVFINKTNTFPTIKPGCEVLRIRVQNGKYFLTYKKAVANELDRIEREVEVGDRQVTEDIVNFLGFKEIIKVDKKRIKTRWGDYEICLDEVLDLGKFIEIEKMTNESDGEKIQGELLLFLNDLGIPMSDRVFQGYDTMLYEQQQK